MGRCVAPCELGDGAAQYPAIAQAVSSSWLGDVRPVLRSVRVRLRKLVAQERFEEAGTISDRLTAYYRTSLRFHRLRSLALCFLHSYRNDAHERQAVEYLRAHHPDIDVTASHEVWSQQSEYERAVLTVLNVYVKPLMAG